LAGFYPKYGILVDCRNLYKRREKGEGRRQEGRSMIDYFSSE
jgi:hypothetical protein